jgi:anti-anti-sigma regulatory factor
MPTQARLALADLVPAAYRQRLAELAVAQSQVTVDCGKRERLPVPFLAAACEFAGNNKGFLSLTGLTERARQAVLLSDPAGSIAIDDVARTAKPPGERAFEVVLDDQGQVRIRANRGLGQHRALAEGTSQSWLQGLEAGPVSVDLAEIEHVNSVVVAWLLQMSRALAPARLELLHVNAQVSTQLVQLRLDHLMVIAKPS